MADTPTGAIVVRSDVPAAASYYAHREPLRLDFWFACAYCSIAETEAFGIGFEIDHYLPRSKFPDLAKEYANLYWSCRICNGRKRDVAPNEEYPEREIIRVDVEHPDAHIEPDGLSVRGLTPKGEFNVEWLDLNRAQLRRLREIRESINVSAKEIAWGVHAILSVRIDRLSVPQKAYLLRLRRQAGITERRFEESTAAFVRSSARSPLLDDDDEPPESTGRRRAFLKRKKAFL